MTFVASIDSEGAQNFFGCFCLIWQSMETTKNVTAKIMNLIRVKTISSIYWNIYLIASKVLVLVYRIIPGHWRGTDKKKVVKYFIKFTAQHLYKSLRSLRSATLLKVCNFIKKRNSGTERNSGTSVFLWIWGDCQEHFRWLLLFFFTI